MMKRLLALLLTCLLALPPAGMAADEPSAALVPGENLLDRFDARPYQVQAMAAWQDTLLMADYSRLFMLRGGQAWAGRLNALLGHALAWRQVVPLPGEDGLWLLDKNTGTLWPVDITAEGLTAGAPQALYWDDYRYPMGDYVEVDAPEHYAVVGGQLYALEGDGRVMAFDPADGQKRPSGLEGAQWLAAYPGGQLIMLCWQEDTPEGKPRSPMIRVADPVSGQARDIRPLLGDAQRALPVRAACYQPAGDTLYAQLGDTVYSYAGLGEGQPAALPPHDDMGMGNMPMAAMPGGVLVFATFRDVHVRAADAGDFVNRVTLNVLIGDLNSRGVNQAAGGLIGIDVQVTEQGISQEDLAQLMITKDDTYDLFWVNLSWLDFDRLMRKGYCVDLSASDLLRQNHAQLSPVVRRAAGGDQAVYALPVSAYATVCLQDSAFAGQRPIHTLDDLVSFLERWPQDHAQAYPHMLPLSTEGLRHRAHAMVLGGYINGYIGSGRALTFDTPLLRQLFGRMAALDWAALGEDRSDEYVAPVLFDNEWMFSPSMMDGDGRDSHTYLPFLPAPEPGMAGALPLSVSAVFINPFSGHQPEAIALLEALVGHIPPDARLMLYHQDSTPVENPLYRQTLEDQQARVDQILFEAQQAAGDRRQELEESARRVAGHLEEMRHSARWLISAEQMAAWQAFSTHAFVVTRDGERQGAQAAMDVLVRYTDGQMNLEQFIQEAEGRLRLVREENEQR